MKKSDSAPLKTAIPGLPPAKNDKTISRLSVKSSNSSPQYEDSKINIDTTETTNQGKTEKEAFKLWNGKMSRYRTMPRQNINLSNKFEILGEDEEVPVLTNEHVLNSKASKSKYYEADIEIP